MLVLVELLPEVFTRLEVVEAELLGLVVEAELLGRVEDEEEVLLLGLVVEVDVVLVASYAILTS